MTESPMQGKGTYQRGQMGQAAPRTLQQFAPMLNKYTAKFLVRAQGLGVPLDADDIKQELSIIFMRCVDAYDESKGGSFMNFVISAMYYEMNRLMARDQRNANLYRTVPAVALNNDGEAIDDCEFGAVDSGWATPEQNLEALQSLETLMASLSPQARVVVENLVNPSPEVIRQFELQERGSRSIRLKGHTARAMLQLNAVFLCNLFGFSTDLTANVRKEIKTKTRHAFMLGYQS